MNRLSFSNCTLIDVICHNTDRESSCNETLVQHCNPEKATRLEGSGVTDTIGDGAEKLAEGKRGVTKLQGYREMPSGHGVTTGYY